MANQPLLMATVKVTARDVNGNNVAKQFNSVDSLSIDYNKGTVNVVDLTGSYYFALNPMTTVTYTITPNPGGLHAVVMS